MNEHETISLMEKRKKGMLAIVFSRFGLMVLLLLLEVAIIVTVVEFFNGYYKQLAVIQMIFTIVMLFYLINSDMDATGKLTWLFLLMVVPIPASILLWFTKKDIGHRMVKWRTEELIRDTRNILKQDEETIKDPELVNSGTDDLSTYLNHSGCFPVYRNTETKFFPLGEYKFDALMEELKKAEKFIYMEYFIIDEGYMWGSILKVLADKAKEGVDVRVMYDGMCEVSLLSHDYPQRMEKLGIRCKPFTPISPFLSTQYNYRDHRKIVVIDGKVAFNGGVNLADEYINRIERFGHWKDTAVMLKGEAVQSFTAMFLQMWNITEPDADWEAAKISYKSDVSDGFVMPYCDCPLDDYKAGENVYIDILYRAKTYVHIMTPYLILDNEMETALAYAALRGVDVKIILPGIEDKTVAYALAKTHYKQLSKYGVKIYEYKPGFVHAKVFVSDNEKAVIGTINLDYRSLYHHFECATYMFKTSCIADIEADYQETLEKCRLITPERIKCEKLKYKIIGTFLKLFAPLM